MKKYLHLVCLLTGFTPGFAASPALPVYHLSAPDPGFVRSRLRETVRALSRCRDNFRPADPLTYSGVAFYDAVTLYQYYQGGGADTAVVNGILAHYVSHPDYGAGNANWRALNPLMAGFTPAAKLVSSVQDNANNGLRTLTANRANIFGAADAASTLNGIDVTQYVQAFADFLRDRMQQELTIAYLNKFETAIASSPVIAALLPKTLQVFQTNGPFSIPSMGAAYKAALAADLAALPSNFENYVFGSLYTHFSADQKNFFVISCSLYDFADQAGKGYLPVDVLNTVALKYKYDAAGNNVQSAYLVSVLNMFSQNLRSTDGQSWISKNDLRLANPDLMRIFFALLYDKYRMLFTDPNHYLGTQTLQQILSNVPTGMDRVAALLVLVNNIDQKVNSFKKIDASAAYTGQKQTALDLYTGLTANLPDLIEFVLTLDPDYRYNTTTSQLLMLSKNAVDIAQAIHSNNPGKTVNGSVTLIENVLVNDPAVAKLGGLLTFVSDLAGADSSARIKAILEHYAAPVQSYITIRQSPLSFTLASYPGIYVGTERNGPAHLPLFNSYTFGVTAPIGLALNWGGTNKTASSSKTLFLSAVDIGAALSYRWDSQTSDIPNKITLGQIFSPGVDFVYGFANSPLVLKAGYQYCPELRDISSNGNTIAGAGVWRLSLGLCVDIPIYIISSKPITR